MGRIILVTGGCRSGKSDHAQQLAESLQGPRTFVATCPVIDDEMRNRIDKHRESRSSREWDATIEEPLDLAGAILRSAPSGVVLVDCLTLWVNNLMFEADMHSRRFDEDGMLAHCAGVIRAATDRNGVTIFVTGEAGLGIVPESTAGRLYRDLLGRTNRAVAASAQEVTLVICGIPVKLK